MSVTDTRPVIERIAVVLHDRLEKLAAGYSPTAPIREVIRPKRLDTYTPKHMQIVLSQGNPEEIPGLARPGNPPAIAYQQPFNIRCHLLPSEKDPTSFDEYVNTLHADVVEVVTDAGAQWMTFGNLAIDAEWKPIELIEDEEGVTGFTVPLVITYRVSEWTPYQVRA